MCKFYLKNTVLNIFFALILAIFIAFFEISRPTPLAFGILFNNDKIILPKRSKTLKKMPDMYEFPGGKVEQGETLKEALKRELNEELSIDVNIEDIIEFPNNVLETERFILTVFIVKKWSNELTINPEINSTFLEVSLDELINVKDLLETDKQLIPSLLEFLK